LVKVSVLDELRLQIRQNEPEQTKELYITLIH